MAELRAYYESAEGNRFAPTTLEEYGCCPFRYFLRRLLKLIPLETPEMELAPREEGSLVHEILRQLFTRLRDEGRLPLTDAATAQIILHEEAEAVFARWATEHTTGEPLLWEIEKGKIRTVLEKVVAIEAEDDSGFVPARFEHSFDSLEVVDEDGARIFLTGTIDRMDRGAGDGRLRVVDYKMGGGQREIPAISEEGAARENLVPDAGLSPGGGPGLRGRGGCASSPVYRPLLAAAQARLR